MSKQKFKVGDVINNDKYGNYEIVSNPGRDEKIRVRFHNTGFECDFHRSVICYNRVKDYMHPTKYGIGYLGAPTINDEDPIKALITRMWNSMMIRCYDPKKLNEAGKSYRNCTISRDWWNLENFKSWCIDQISAGYYQDGWELDKDLLVKGNTLYSSETCVFLPVRLNQLQQVKKDSEYNWLPGVNFDKSRGKFKSEVNFDGKRYYFPRRETELESFLEYKELKEKLVQADAENWKGKIHPRAYESLKNYSLDWVLEEYKQ